MKKEWKRFYLGNETNLGRRGSGGEKCGGDDGGGGMSRREIIQFWVVPEGVFSLYNKSWKQKKKETKKRTKIALYVYL